MASWWSLLDHQKGHLLVLIGVKWE